MDSSRRAVESYWRSRMIDGATSDEDKVTPVYKLEEICELLRSSHVSIVKEVSEFILKRLNNKSPIVKQKALRIIKYAVGKSGTEFRREMQRNSVAVRQLIHYKGQPDPLKGDALNKAVRETAQEALSAIFASDNDTKPAAQSESHLGSRIQGFGNTNYEMPRLSSDDKKSFLSEVVGMGSATLKQGISSLTQSPSLKQHEMGSYRSPNLRRSLTTTETDYEGGNYQSDGQSGSSRVSKNVGNSGNWGQDLRTEMTNDRSASGSSFQQKTREERLVETIVTSGGVRLQPTRDALQVFLAEASKLDALALSHALELKLQSPMWQARMKAVCVLEAILRKKDDEHFSTVALYFSENIEVVAKCSESPQASLREKANKVLHLLGGGERVTHEENTIKSETSTVQVPDLIDTGDADELFGIEEPSKLQSDNSNVIPISSATPVDDLFGGISGSGVGSSEQKNDDDPFADVSFHTNNDKDHAADLLSGITIDNSTTAEPLGGANRNGPQLFDIFGSSPDVMHDQLNASKDVGDIMAGLSIDGSDSHAKQNGISPGKQSQNFIADSALSTEHKVPDDVLSSILGSQAAGTNSNPMFPLGAMGYNLPPGYMFNPALVAQSMNYNAMGSLFAQQQFLATMSNFQQLGNLQPGASISSSDSNIGYSSALPDIFNPSIPTQASTSLMNSSKKEETKAFDFISDHLAAARDPKRVV